MSHCISLRVIPERRDIRSLKRCIVFEIKCSMRIPLIEICDWKKNPNLYIIGRHISGSRFDDVI